jgi:hypothetical protein
VLLCRDHPSQPALCRRLLAGALLQGPGTAPTLCAKVEDGLIALEARVRAGRLSDPAKIGAAADRILRDSGVGRCFKITVRKGCSPGTSTRRPGVMTRSSSAGAM